VRRGLIQLADGKAAITGDFVTTANEVEPLIKTLRTKGIEVTALHNHMLDDEPRLSSFTSGRTTTRSNSLGRCAPASIRFMSQQRAS
jgi:hypothetical protein